MSEEHDSDQIASRLLLDIKALTILHPSEPDLRSVLEKSSIDYSDNDVKRVTDAIRPAKPVSRSGSVLVASAEIILASFLAILGIGAFASNIIGYASPQQLIEYFTSRLSGSFGSGPLSEAASLIDLALAVLMVAGALYLLRRAATELKDAGLAPETGGS